MHLTNPQTVRTGRENHDFLDSKTRNPGKKPFIQRYREIFLFLDPLTPLYVPYLFLLHAFIGVWGTFIYLFFLLFPTPFLFPFNFLFLFSIFFSLLLFCISHLFSCYLYLIYLISSVCQYPDNLCEINSTVVHSQGNGCWAN